MRGIKEGLALTAAAAVGASFTLGIKEGQHDRHIAAGNKKLKPVLKPAMVEIGLMTLKALHSQEISGNIRDEGEWGRPTINVATDYGEISIGMNRVNGKLEPVTTSGVMIDLHRPDVSDPRGESFDEILYISEEGDWHADGQVYMDANRGRVAWLEVDASDPNLTNADAITEKAKEMARQVLGLELPPHS